MGQRGEGWVIGQFVLGLLIALAPPSESLRAVGGLRLLGWLLLALGGGLGLLALRALGRNLTPFPKPIEDGQMVQEGLYQIVRHPIYLSLFVGALGWALFRRSLPGLGLTLLLFVLFDAKSRAEERWLVERYPGYRAYQQRVKRLIPWIY